MSNLTGNRLRREGMGNLTGNRIKNKMALKPWLLLALALAGSEPGTAFATMDREVDGFEHSGYFFPKTLVWRGIRSSPGSLWLFFVIFFYCCYDVFVLSLASSFIAGVKKFISKAKAEANTPAESPAPDAFDSIFQSIMSMGMNAEGAMVTTALGFGVLFVSLSATRLSETMEAYLVAMVSIQLLLQLGSSPWAHHGLLGLQLGAVFGIAMLDSYRPLDLLNVTYFAVALFMLVSSWCVGRFQPQMRQGLFFFFSCLQMGFSIAAFVVARKVEGTHRSPMLALLCTACVCTGFSLLQALCLGSMLGKRPQTRIVMGPGVEEMVSGGFVATHSYAY